VNIPSIGSTDCPRPWKSTQQRHLFVEGLLLLAAPRPATHDWGRAHFRGVIPLSCANDPTGHSAHWCRSCNGWQQEREGLFVDEGLAAFDLFAPKAAALLQQSPWIQRLIGEGYPLVIVDEAQDTGVAQHLDYLVAFNRGKRISANLSAAWEMTASYLRARDAQDNALAQDLILDGVDDPDGIQVMTIHKAKGKQFDGVIVLRRESHNGPRLVSNFIWRDDIVPYRRSRKILMVAVTRAKVHTMMVQQVWPGCPIMDAHSLRSAYEQE
jgi:hypothetical protein